MKDRVAASLSHKPRTAREIGERSGVDPAVAARLLGKLAKAGDCLSDRDDYGTLRYWKDDNGLIARILKWL